MRWKAGVIVKIENSCILKYGNREKSVAEESVYIVKAVESGRIDAEKLKYMIMEHEHCDEISAGFSLAQFIVEYGEFIEEPDSYYQIEN